jgi:O-antigen ligase
MFKGGLIIRVLVMLTTLSPYTAMMMAIYMVYKVFTKRLTMHKNYFNIGLLVLFIWSLGVGIFNRSYTSIITSFILLAYFSVSVYVHNNCNTESKVENLLEQLMNFSLFSAGLGFLEKLLSIIFKGDISINLINTFESSGINHRISSTFGNPNIAANWFAVMTIVAIYFYNTSSVDKRFSYKMKAIIFIAALSLTGSRGGFIGLIFGSLIYCFIKKDKKEKRDFRLFSALFIILLLFTFAPPQIFEYITGHNIDGSFNSRFEIWEGSMGMIKDKPFTGWGLAGYFDHGGEYITAYGEANVVLYHGHSIWISLMAMMGIPGLLIYLNIKVHIYKSLKKLYYSRNNIVPLMAAIQALVFIQGLVDFTIIAPQTGLLFIGCSAITSSLARQNSKKAVEDGVYSPDYRSISRVS